jgi:tRNA (mo5U34)-methyltransferase
MAGSQEEVDEYVWWHTIDLGNGVVTPGRKSKAVMEAEAELHSQGLDLAGRSVLDVGSWNGGFAVEAKRRGAARVLATDTYCWRDPQYRGRETFDLVVRATGLDIPAREIDATEISVENVGQFDVVLFLGVFYHLFDAIGTTKRLASVAREVLVVETHMDALDNPRPAMIMYPGEELAGDPTNWWGPNRACMEAILKSVGFGRVAFQQGTGKTRGVFHAWKV